MKISVNSTELRAAVEKCARVLGKEGLAEGIEIRPVPEKGRIAFLSGNGNQFIMTSIPGEIEKEGTALANGRMLSALAAKIPAEENVVISSDDAKVTIRFGKAKTSLSVMTGTISTPGKMTDAVDVRLATKELKSALESAKKFISRDNSRMALTGAFMELSKEGMSVVGMDGFRLYHHPISNKIGMPAEQETIRLIIPESGLTPMIRFMEGENTILRIAGDGKSMAVISGSNTFRTQLLDASYPDYKKIIPASGMKNTIEVSVAELRDALNRASLMADITNNLVRLRVDGNGLTVSGISQKGSTEETLDVKSELTDAEMTIGLNSRYLADALPDGETVMIGFNTPTHPVMIWEKDNDVKSIVLPIRVMEMVA